MQWKEFMYYNRKYSLSEFGDLKRCEYTDTRIQKYNGKVVKLKRTNKEKLIKKTLDKDGYVTYELYSYPNSRKFKLHHLVYMIYVLGLKNIISKNYFGYSFKNQEYTQINHIDGNKNNDHYTNLEVCTLQYNIQEAVKLGIHNSQTKAKYVLVYKNDLYIGEFWKLKTVSSYIQKNYGLKLNTGTLSKYIRDGKEWRGFTFKYL